MEAQRGEGLKGWSPNPEKGAGQRVGGPKGGAQRVEEPEISRFFPFSRPHYHSLVLSLGVFSWNFGGV